MGSRSSRSKEAVIGVDLGTTGVRAIAVDSSGSVLGSAHSPLLSQQFDIPEGWHEQDPLGWWDAFRDCLGELMSALPAGVHSGGICVVSTSGTIVPVDNQGRPLHRALMYNDTRSASLVPEIRQVCQELEERMGYAISSSFALPKILWLLRNQPDLRKKTRRFLHAADFIAGRLLGTYKYSDHSNALKTGYDLIQKKWPRVIEESLSLPLDYLPKVVTPGTIIGEVCPSASRELGIPHDCEVVIGATDGTASQIASGAVEPGAWNATLGTTLVVKGISKSLLIDPLHRLYSHLHPQGWWMPGGASNTGAEWIRIEYPDSDPAELDRKAIDYLPTLLIRYPLVRTGERFPFHHPRAQGFIIGETKDQIELFAAGLEGLALLERLAYDTIEEIGGKVGKQIHVTGAAARSSVWLRIRASALGRQLVRPAVSSTAMGAAILAASSLWFANITEAVDSMVKIERTIEPDHVLQRDLGDKYVIFHNELLKRGYIKVAHAYDTT